MEIAATPARIASAFLACTAVLVTINCSLLFLHYYLGGHELFGLLDLFDLDIEGNIPTLYSAVAVLFCAALLALITYTNWRKTDGRRFYWLGLSLLFVFLGIDEGAAIHEEIGSWLENYFDARGVLYFYWIVPYGIATFVLALAYLKFVWTLPVDTRWRFVLAGVIYLGGALGIEMLGAREADLHDTSTVTYAFLFTLEETLEMLGIVVFIHALLIHLTRETGRVAIILSPGIGGRPSTASKNETTESPPPA